MQIETNFFIFASKDDIYILGDDQGTI